MTTTEVETPDPLGHMRDKIGAGNRTIAGFDDRVFGFIDHGRNYCDQFDPNGRYTCTRVREHNPDWPHIASNYEQILSVWGGREVPPTFEHNGVTVKLGTPISEIPDVHNPDGLYVDPLNWCAHSISDAYLCTRTEGHDGLHVGCTPTQVAAFSDGKGNDPFERVEGGYYNEYPGYSSPVNGLYVLNGRCGHAKPGSDFMCTRPLDHPGAHRAYSNGGRLRWTIPQQGTYATLDTVEMQEPIDGTIGDPDDLKCDAMPDVGVVMRLRNRANRLYVTGSRGSDVETLDLTFGRIRVVPLTAIVPEAETISVDELDIVINWYSGHRNLVKKVAVREMRNGRWCTNGLNQNLQALGLEVYEPTLRGTLVVKLPFECPNPRTQQSEIENTLGVALTSPKILAALKAALPQLDTVELETQHLSVAATDFSRV